VAAKLAIDAAPVLYTTKVAESKSFTVHAAAVCPALGEPGSKFVNACEWSYFRLLTSVSGAHLSTCSKSKGVVTSSRMRVIVPRTRA
jgi:hypothetical protein